MLTVKILKEKIKQFEDDGKINDNTIVCGYSDEFDCIYPRQTDLTPIFTLDINMLIKSEEDKISEFSIESIKERKRKYIEELKKLGNMVLLLT